MIPRLPILVTMLCTAALVGCSSASNCYPSLHIRPGERIAGSSEATASQDPDTPITAPAPSADLRNRLSQLRADAQQAHERFVAAVPGTRALTDAARGSVIGSDAWASAEIALADLELARSEAAIPLAELDILFINASLNREALPEIEDTRDTILTLIDEEDRVLFNLRDEIRQIAE